MSLSQRILLPALAAAALGLAPVSQAADSNVLASVNGKPITQQDYDTYVRENLKGHSQAASKQQVVNELISRELVYQDAMKQGLDKDPEVQKKLEQLKQKLILGAALEKAMSSKPVSDAELKKLYNEKLADFNVKEFKARHILLKNKSDAEKVITELDMGADFADLAKKKSTGPSGKKGGDLGWFAPGQMVPAFSAAVSKMKKGEYTKQPVKTQFGWHVIKLEDTRQAEPPSFDSVKSRLQKVVQQRHVGEYIRSLKDKADIKVNP